MKFRGIKARSMKCGPDYIDPMFHRKVLGIPARNVDLFFTNEEVTKALFHLEEEDYERAIPYADMLGKYLGYITHSGQTAALSAASPKCGCGATDVRTARPIPASSRNEPSASGDHAGIG